MYVRKKTSLYSHDDDSETLRQDGAIKSRAVAARLFSLRFSHRFQRIAKAQLIMYSASPNDSGVVGII